MGQGATSPDHGTARTVRSPSSLLPHPHARVARKRNPRGCSYRHLLKSRGKRFNQCLGKVRLNKISGPGRPNGQNAIVLVSFWKISGQAAQMAQLTGTVRLKGIKPFARGCLKHNSGRCMLILLVRYCVKGFPEAL